jgi:hypothetical protein
MATNPKQYGVHGFTSRLKSKAVREAEHGRLKNDGKAFTPRTLQIFMSMYLQGASFDKIGRRLQRNRDITVDRIDKLIVGYSKLDRDFQGPLENRTGLPWAKGDEFVYSHWLRIKKMKKEDRPEYAKATMDEDRLYLLLGRQRSCKVLQERLGRNKAACKGFGL